jgi:hypothetical protein
VTATEVILIIAAIGLVVDRVIAYFDRKQERAQVATEKEAERKRIKEEKELGEAREDARIERERLAAKEVREVKAAAVEVKDTLKETTKAQTEGMKSLTQIATDTQKTGALTHDLVNSASLVQLRLYAVAARRIADLTKEPADLEAAATAEKLHHEHEIKQQQATANAVKAGGKP